MAVRTVYLQHTISIFTVRAFGPRLTVVRTVIFELRFLPYVWACPDGNPRCPDGWSNLPLNWTWKESEADRSLRGVRTGSWNVLTDSSWNSSFSKQWRSGRESTLSGQMILGLSGRPDSMAHRPDGWKSGQMSIRMGWHVVRTANKEPKSSDL
jgi:hypothetical protein